MANALLMVVDFQNDFVDGALGFEGAELLDDRIANKVKSYGKGKVFYVKDTHDDNYLTTREGIALPVKHCIEGTDGWQIYGETRRALEAINAPWFTKTTFGIDPEKIRHYAGAKTLEIAGLVTNMCVISNVCVFQAISPETQIIVDSQLCASFDEELHYKALDVLRGLQVDVL